MNILDCPIPLPLMRLGLMLDVRYIAVHCSATPPTMNIGVADIDQWHRKARYSCVGYHYVIRRSGVIEKGRPENKSGAHVHGFNSHAVGVCLAGGVDAEGRPENNYTPAQMQALRELLKVLASRYPRAVIQGHRDFPDVAKACPCFDVRAWLKEAN